MGNTKVSIRDVELCQDHPHIHGEYDVEDGEIAAILGSPPHTWGILSAGILISRIIRITPTYMGNTISKVAKNAKSQDHPHIHGEYATKATGFVGLMGSPPHTWGIQ